MLVNFGKRAWCTLALFIWSVTFLLCLVLSVTFLPWIVFLWHSCFVTQLPCLVWDILALSCFVCDILVFDTTALSCLWQSCSSLSCLVGETLVLYLTPLPCIRLYGLVFDTLLRSLSAYYTIQTRQRLLEKRFKDYRLDKDYSRNQSWQLLGLKRMTGSLNHD